MYSYFISMSYLDSMTNYKDWSKSQDYYSNLVAGNSSALAQANGADLSSITGNLSDINSALQGTFDTAQSAYATKVGSADTEEVSAQARIQETHTGLEAAAGAAMLLPAGIKAAQSLGGKAATRGGDLVKSGQSAARDARGPQTTEVEEESHSSRWR